MATTTTDTPSSTAAEASNVLTLHESVFARWLAAGSLGGSQPQASLGALTGHSEWLKSLPGLATFGGDFGPQAWNLANQIASSPEMLQRLTMQSRSLQMGELADIVQIVLEELEADGAIAELESDIGQARAVAGRQSQARAQAPAARRAATSKARQSNAAATANRRPAQGHGKSLIGKQSQLRDMRRLLNELRASASAPQPAGALGEADQRTSGGDNAPQLPTPSGPMHPDKAAAALATAGLAFGHDQQAGRALEAMRRVAGPKPSIGLAPFGSAAPGAFVGDARVAAQAPRALRWAEAATDRALLQTGLADDVQSDAQKFLESASGAGVGRDRAAPAAARTAFGQIGDRGAAQAGLAAGSPRQSGALQGVSGAEVASIGPAQRISSATQRISGKSERMSQWQQAARNWRGPSAVPAPAAGRSALSASGAWLARGQASLPAVASAAVGRGATGADGADVHSAGAAVVGQANALRGGRRVGATGANLPAIELAGFGPAPAQLPALQAAVGFAAQFGFAARHALQSGDLSGAAQPFQGVAATFASPEAYFAKFGQRAALLSARPQAGGLAVGETGELLAIGAELAADPQSDNAAESRATVGTRSAASAGAMAAQAAGLRAGAGAVGATVAADAHRGSGRFANVLRAPVAASGAVNLPAGAGLPAWLAARAPVAAVADAGAPRAAQAGRASGRAAGVAGEQLAQLAAASARLTAAASVELGGAGGLAALWSDGQAARFDAVGGGGASRRGGAYLASAQAVPGDSRATTAGFRGADNFMAAHSEWLQVALDEVSRSAAELSPAGSELLPAGSELAPAMARGGESARPSGAPRPVAAARDVRRSPRDRSLAPAAGAAVDAVARTIRRSTVAMSAAGGSRASAAVAAASGLDQLGALTSLAMHGQDGVAGWLPQSLAAVRGPVANLGRGSNLAAGKDGGSSAGAFRGDAGLRGEAGMRVDVGERGELLAIGSEAEAAAEAFSTAASAGSSATRQGAGRASSRRAVAAAGQASQSPFAGAAGKAILRATPAALGSDAPLALKTILKALGESASAALPADAGSAFLARFLGRTDAARAVVARMASASVPRGELLQTDAAADVVGAADAGRAAQAVPSSARRSAAGLGAASAKAGATASKSIASPGFTATAGGEDGVVLTGLAALAALADGSLLGGKPLQPRAMAVGDAPRDLLVTGADATSDETAGDASVGNAASAGARSRSGSSARTGSAASRDGQSTLTGVQMHQFAPIGLRRGRDLVGQTRRSRWLHATTRGTFATRLSSARSAARTGYGSAGFSYGSSALGASELVGLTSGDGGWYFGEAAPAPTAARGADRLSAAVHARRASSLGRGHAAAVAHGAGAAQSGAPAMVDGFSMPSEFRSGQDLVQPGPSLDAMVEAASRNSGATAAHKGTQAAAMTRVLSVTAAPTANMLPLVAPAAQAIVAAAAAKPLSESIATSGGDATFGMPITGVGDHKAGKTAAGGGGQKAQQAAEDHSANVQDIEQLAMKIARSVMVRIKRERERRGFHV